MTGSGQMSIVPVQARVTDPMRNIIFIKKMGTVQGKY